MLSDEHTGYIGPSEIISRVQRVSEHLTQSANRVDRRVVAIFCGVCM